MMKAHLERMLRSMAWANQQAIAAVRDCPPAHAEALPLLSHLLAAEHVWLARLQQREATVPVWPKLDISACERLAADNVASYTAYLAGLSEAQLGRPIRYRNTK